MHIPFPQITTHFYDVSHETFCNTTTHKEKRKGEENYEKRHGNKNSIRNKGNSKAD